MVSTVHPDRKLMVATSRTPTASNAGLMMTPPPIPQIAPAMEAPKLTIRKIKYTIRFIIIYPTPSFSYCKNDLPVYYYTTIHKSPWSFTEKQWNFYSNVCVCIAHFRINVRYSIPGSPARSPSSCCTQIFPADS